MPNRVNDLAISKNDPFGDDPLGRKQLVTDLYDAVCRVDGPYVMALTAPWGEGKTTVVRMLEACINQHDEVSCVYFDAWATDYTKYPLAALSSQIFKSISVDRKESAIVPEHTEKAKEILMRLTVKAANWLCKSKAGVDMDFEGIYKWYCTIRENKRSERNHAALRIEELAQIESVMRDLELAIRDRLPQNEQAASPQKKLVVLVDELDRCRPSYSVELLERIKHVFSLPDIVFVLAMDEKQLEASVLGVYGSEIDAEEYLRRFFDYRSALPRLSGGNEEFTKNLLRRAGEALIHDEDQEDIFIGAFTTYADLMGLSLRARANCISQFAVNAETLNGTASEYSYYLAGLILALHSANPDLYDKLARSEASWDDMTDYLFGLGTFKSLSYDKKLLIESYFISLDRENFGAKRARLAEDSQGATLDPEEKKHAGDLLKLVDDFALEPEDQEQVSDLAELVDDFELDTAPQLKEILRSIDISGAQ